MKSATLDIGFTPEAHGKLTDMACRIIGSPIDSTARNPVAQRANAARRPASQQTLDAMLEVMEETIRLVNEGHTVIGLEIRCGRPVIELAPSDLLARMATAEHGASYMAHGNTNGITRRTGELLRRACRVIWIEQGA